MVKSLHRSLEAKLASIKDPEHSESDGEEANNDVPSEYISSKRSGKGTKHKGKKKGANPNASEDENQPSTVIYLGHLPVGFEEREITVFLNQFGNVKRCRVSRSTKTGRSRGYAFVDFADAEVTKIVAETMSGYFLLEKRLVCHIVPNDKVHELMFAKPNGRVPTKADRQKKARVEMNKRRSAEALKGITAKLVKREELKRKKLSSLGIDYEFPGYAGSGQKALDELNEGSKKKKQKVSDRDEEEEGTNSNEEKAPKSQTKKKKKPKKSVEGTAVGEKENDRTKHVNKTATPIAEPSKKKKQKISDGDEKEKTTNNNKEKAPSQKKKESRKSLGGGSVNKKENDATKDAYKTAAPSAESSKKKKQNVPDKDKEEEGTKNNEEAPKSQKKKKKSKKSLGAGNVDDKENPATKDVYKTATPSAESSKKKKQNVPDEDEEEEGTKNNEEAPKSQKKKKKSKKSSAGGSVEEKENGATKDANKASASIAESSKKKKKSKVKTPKKAKTPKK